MNCVDDKTPRLSRGHRRPRPCRKPAIRKARRDANKAADVKDAVHKLTRKHEEEIEPVLRAKTTELEEL